MEEGILSESKLKVLKVNSEKENSDFECTDRSEGKPVHVEIDKKSRGKQTHISIVTELIGRR